MSTGSAYFFCSRSYGKNYEQAFRLAVARRENKIEHFILRGGEKDGVEQVKFGKDDETRRNKKDYSHTPSTKHITVRTKILLIALPISNLARLHGILLHNEKLMYVLILSLIHI